MSSARAKAPTLVWILTTLSSLLVGMAIAESRHQSIAVPVWTPTGTVEASATGASPSGANAPPIPTPARPQATPSVGDISVPIGADAVIVRVARLIVPPAVELVPETASGWVVLLVESGSLLVRVTGQVYVGQGLDPAQFESPLSTGERLVIAPGARYSVLNDGPTIVRAITVTLAAGGR